MGPAIVGLRGFELFAVSHAAAPMKRARHIAGRTVRRSTAIMLFAPFQKMRTPETECAIPVID
jgi:hypothetical protein